MVRVKIADNGDITLKKLDRFYAAECKYNKNMACSLRCVMANPVIAKGGMVISLCDKEAIRVTTSDLESSVDMQQCADDCMNDGCKYTHCCTIYHKNKETEAKAKAAKKAEAERKEEERKKSEAAREKKALKLVKKKKRGKKEITR
jgi:hypothetical protein